MYQINKGFLNIFHTNSRKRLFGKILNFQSKFNVFFICFTPCKNAIKKYTFQIKITFGDLFTDLLIYFKNTLTHLGCPQC